MAETVLQRLVTTRLTLDINLSDNIQKSVSVTRGDTSRRFEVTLVEGGRPFPLGYKWAVCVKAIKPSGAELSLGCVIENGKIIFDFSGNEQIATEAGAFAVHFRIYDEIGGRISTPKIWLTVVPDENKDEPSESQDTFLQDIVETNQQNEKLRTEAVAEVVNWAKQTVKEASDTNDSLVQAEIARQALSAETIRALNDTNAAVQQDENQRKADEIARQTLSAETIQALNATNTAVQQDENQRKANENARQTLSAETIQALNATNTAVQQEENQRKTNENAREALKGELVKLKADLQEMVDALPDRVAELPALIERINAVLDSDDDTLDELSEIVTYIKSNKSLIETITTSKVNVADIIDNLVTNAANKPLSAAQGYKLKGLVDTAQTAANEAKTAAGNAQTTANEAKTAAGNAQTTANEAKTAAGNAQTTANEVAQKVNQLKTEPWTFALEDGSTVTKAVYVG